VRLKEKYTGIAIALAWPQTYCKQPGSWYDPLLLRLGINTNNYYRVGHAALVLIDSRNKKLHYFDFGRYHAPYQYGRVRSAETDHDLKLEVTPVLSSDQRLVLNFREILIALQLNKACHGEGELHASYCAVDFKSAFNKVHQMQQASPLPYGPFRPKGSNCSRFVNTAIQAGNPRWKNRFRLKYLRVLSPTPMNNIASLQNRLVLPHLLKTELFRPLHKLNKSLIKSTLQQPDRNPKIPDNAQWLSGEGAGSWFVYSYGEKQLQLTRYSPEGIVECTGLFDNKSDLDVVPDDSFRITYPSNCNEITLVNEDKVLRFERLNKPGAPKPARIKNPRFVYEEAVS